ncbi:hypothetical protein M2350_000718 [Candidatus Fervidibacter sacchari]|uniref:Uncharacterized protein n=1 Tax=Candidatus Fervidibacter sacchari TaxID=1448929 RepID=A0ABT2EKA7_9BACT|nr:hypothetical protein [Candidatus Fervidibacter sacchari]MCS3918321.1 hypothetical protein [Candidatus Fervidibacter sacchari]
MLKSRVRFESAHDGTRVAGRGTGKLGERCSCRAENGYLREPLNPVAQT